MRFLYFILLFICFLASCSEPVNPKQLLAEQAIREFEVARSADSTLPVPKWYDDIDKDVLPFAISPESNYFPYLNLSYRDYNFNKDYLQSLFHQLKDAEKNDKNLVGEIMFRIDSMTRIDSLIRTEELIEKNARDSCRKLLGDREYFHFAAHDSTDKIICEYMLDTVSFEVVYWRFRSSEVYRSKNQKPRR